METLLAALFGALVGGFASTYGALIVGKRSRTRAERARIYDDLLPELMRLVPGREPRSPKSLTPDTYRDGLEPIRRAGHVIGGIDAEKVDSLAAALDEWAGLSGHRTETFDPATGRYEVHFDLAATQTDYEKLSEAFVSAVYGYSDWLESQLDKRF